MKRGKPVRPSCVCAAGVIMSRTNSVSVAGASAGVVFPNAVRHWTISQVRVADVSTVSRQSLPGTAVAFCATIARFAPAHGRLFPLG